MKEANPPETYDNDAPPLTPLLGLVATLSDSRCGDGSDRRYVGPHAFTSPFRALTPPPAGAIAQDDGAAPTAGAATTADDAAMEVVTAATSAHMRSRHRYSSHQRSI